MADEGVDSLQFDGDSFYIYAALVVDVNGKFYDVPWDVARSWSTGGHNQWFREAKVERSRSFCLSWFRERVGETVQIRFSTDGNGMLVDDIVLPWSFEGYLYQVSDVTVSTLHRSRGIRGDLTGKWIAIGTGHHLQRVSHVRADKIVDGAKVVLASFEVGFPGFVVEVGFDLGIPETCGEAVDA